jgi:hypothetical protein
VWRILITSVEFDIVAVVSWGKLYGVVLSGINLSKSPASGAGNVTEPSLTSQVGTVRVDQFVQSEWWRCQYWSAYVAAAFT